MLAALIAPAAFAADFANPAVPAAKPSIDQTALTAAKRAWKISLAPFAAGQTLDAASSYGRPELNPLIASSDGGFGTKAAIVKVGVSGALVGVEYLLVRKYPRSARVLAKLNWSGAVLSTSLAVHNFALR
jgi:hypothetical protein